VPARVAPDVPNRLVEPGDDLDGEYVVEELRFVVRLGRGNGLRQNRAGLFAAADFDGFLPQSRGDRGQRGFRDLLVDEQRLERVADRRARGLRVEHDVRGHLDVRGLFNVRVAVADAGLDDRDRRVLDHGADQPRAAAGDQAVHVAVQTHEGGRDLARRVLDQRNAVLVEAGGYERGAHRPGDLHVRVQRLLAAAQHAGVAGLQADCRGVGGDVRARLVDDADDAERHRDLLHLEPAVERRAREHAADGVGEAHHVAHALGHRPDARIGERQPVDHRRREPRLAARLDVQGVRREDRRRMLDQRVRDRRERAVLPGGRGVRERKRGAPGRFADTVQLQHVNSPSGRGTPCRSARRRTAGRCRRDRSRR